MKPTSRRELLSLGTVAGMTTLLDSRRIANGAENDETPAPLVENVKRFGAVGDALSDDAAAFQHALDAAHKSGCGTVYAPPGRYLLKRPLTIPNGVSLRGSFSCVPSHNGIRDHGQPKPGDDGTALFVTAGQGHEDGQPLLTLNTNSSVSGLTIYYPNQVLDGDPIAYPWSIWVDAIYDIGRIENVHFNPWWNSHGAVYEWQTANGEAFIFGRSDWEYVLNTFCFGYRVGYKFVETNTGKCNGNFLGIGADDCNRAILVEQSAPYGLLIANGEFTSFHGSDPTMVEVRASNKGVVRISNSAFWGPCNQIARIDGQGTVGFSDCTFVQWGKEGDRAAIQANSGSLFVRGCEFRQKLRHISLGEAVNCAVITGNIFRGAAQIDNASKNDVQIGLNAALP